MSKIWQWISQNSSREPDFILCTFLMVDYCLTPIIFARVLFAFAEENKQTSHYLKGYLSNSAMLQNRVAASNLLYWLMLQFPKKEKEKCCRPTRVNAFGFAYLAASVIDIAVRFDLANLCAALIHVAVRFDLSYLAAV